MTAAVHAPVGQGALPVTTSTLCCLSQDVEMSLVHPAAGAVDDLAMLPLLRRPR